MKNNEKKTARRVQTIAVCGCLCLLAVGAGVTYRAFDQSHREDAAVYEPVTAVQTKELDVSVLERNQRSNDPGEAPEPEKKAPAKVKNRKEAPVFAYPLQGEVVLPYSIDHAIYDPTLEQYRTNASVSLSAEKGAEVKASAAGTVKEITEDAEAGNLVIIEHADGWQTAYGQLADTLQVKEGEPVTQGQVIGAVELPTKYGAALGSHLEFAMEKDGKTVDPMKKLENE